MKKSKIILSVLLSLFLLTPVFSGCGGKTKISNENTTLIFASGELDGVFNPFFYSSGTDGDIVNITQISMLTTNKEGTDIAWGENEPVVTLDFDRDTRVEQGATVTEYTFVLKNDVKFSDGVPLTIKDVLFNYYVYLDPVYTGSSTLYSVDIQGMKAYRAQSESTFVQDTFEESFQEEANVRVGRLTDAVNQIWEDFKGSTVSIAKMRTELAAMDAATTGSTLLKDYNYADTLFKAELNTDFNNISEPEDGKLKNKIEVFFYNNGLITIEPDGRIDYKGIDSSKHTRESAIELVYNNVMTGQFTNIINGWMTAVEMRKQFAAEAMEVYFQQTGKTIQNITGITAPKTGVTLRGGKSGEKSYSAPVYDRSGKLTSGYEVLRVKINGVDPKAVWNFGLTIAPMHYYSDAERINKFDGVENFGVEFGSESFFTNVLKGGEKVGLPRGAGPYRPTNMDGSESVTKRGEFFNNNIVYFLRNDHFIMGPPKIKKLAYQVISKDKTVDAMAQGQIHYSQIDATTVMRDKVENSKNLMHVETETMGYGYIGLNAGKIPNIDVRRAIMSAMDTSLCLDYYPGLARPIYRPMSLQSWAYPTDVKAHEYPFNRAMVSAYLTRAGYTSKNGLGKLVNREGKEINYTFTIAGESLDQHPSYKTLKQAAEILNGLGCTIVVKPDNDALKKLASGGLAVWAAAWSSTIDPDMYQVYHIKSKAASVLNWGYAEILANRTLYSTEYAIIKDLSDLIDRGRESEDISFRKGVYKQALNKIMELAVELPTYQRQDMYIYNSKLLNASSMTKKSEVTAFNGLITKIWELSFIEG